MAYLIEIGYPAAALAVLVLYHVHYYVKLSRKPEETALGLANRLRRLWVDAVMKGHPDVIAVQTMRNWIMAASFMASTAVLLSLGMLHVSFTPPQSGGFLDLGDCFGITNESLWRLKWLLLGADLFFAFFNFSLAIRHYNHAGFIMELPPSCDENTSPDRVTHILNRGAFFNSLGMRGYYLTIPVTLWLLGPAWLLVGTIGLTILLYKLDRTI